VSEAVDDPTEHDPIDQDAANQGATERSNEASPMTTEAAEQDPEALAEIDVVRIEADLDGVQAALTRLNDGTYWTDEVTGEPIPVDVLDANPLARRA
jgi:RNA polymerase-binding transcription factor DksA